LLLLQPHQPGVEADMTSKPIFIRDSYKGSGKLQGKVAIITGGRKFRNSHWQCIHVLVILPVQEQVQ
jgi:hypothetical protein